MWNETKATGLVLDRCGSKKARVIYFGVSRSAAGRTDPLFFVLQEIQKTRAREAATGLLMLLGMRTMMVQDADAIKNTDHAVGPAGTSQGPFSLAC